MWTSNSFLSGYYRRHNFKLPKDKFDFNYSPISEYFKFYLTGYKSINPLRVGYIE